MGNELSTENSILSQDEIRRLRMRFSKIDVDNSGSLTKSEILNIPGLKQNPLVDRVLNVLDVDSNGEIDLNEFIMGISLFSSRGDIDVKIRFIFDIYDVNRDGYVTNGELFSVVKSMVGNNLKDAQLQQIVDKTMVLYDSDKDGRISFDEFKRIASNFEIYKSMSLEI